MRTLSRNLIAAMLLCVGAIVAQGQVMPLLPDTGATKADPSVKLPTYEIASVKPHKGDDNMMRIQTKPDGFAATNLPLSSLIMFAYATRQDLITGGPAWMRTARFDVEAKVAAEDVDVMKKLTPKQRQSMLQAVLAERFQLQLHNEDKVLPVYDLTVAKGGPKLTAAAPEPPPDPDAKPGDMPKRGGMMTMGPGELSGRELPASSIARQLASVLQHDVVDKTGLTGAYDFTLNWTPDNNPAQAATDSGTDSAPSIFTAVQEQLGLKLVSSKGSVQTLVVDHAQMPTEN